MDLERILERHYFLFTSFSSLCAAAAKKIVKSLSELISGGFQPFGTILQQEEGCARCQITIRVLLPWPPQLRPLRPLRSLYQLQLGDRRVCFGLNISDSSFVNIYFLRLSISIQKKDTNARKISQNRKFAVFYKKNISNRQGQLIRRPR